jgi:formylglycine-generating enzyme required for sulfatase activity
MTGNVYEWTSTMWYDGNGSPITYVYRGGGWLDSVAWVMAVGNRFGDRFGTDYFRLEDLGFRCAKTP